MMRLASIEDALSLAIEKFRGVTDKDGQPYILHLLRVMLAAQDSDGQIVALLHDIVEDTSVTLSELRDRGFSETVIQAIECLTHRPEDSYATYIVRMKQNPLASICKLADLHDNYRLDRVAYRDGYIQQDAHRIQRYVLSYQFLRGKLDEPTYRRLMLALE